MKRPSLSLLLCFIIVLFAVICSSSKVSLNSRHLQGPTRQPLSLEDPPERPDTALVAAPDGTIFLFGDSGGPIWSFSSGPDIYSSYQGQAIEYFIGCGDDWELYFQTIYGKSNISMSIEEYFSSTPQIEEDGGIVLGSKKTTVFLVDFRTGRVIHKYGVSENPNDSTIKEQNQFGSDLETDEPQLYITRIDYTLTSFMPNSDIVRWNMTIADFFATLLCKDIDRSLDNTHGVLPYKNMPFPCRGKVRVFRAHNSTKLEALQMPKMLSVDHQEDLEPPASESDVLPSQPNVEKVVSRNVKFLYTRDKKDLKPVLPSLTFNAKNGTPNMLDVEIFSNEASVTIIFKYSTFKLILVIVLVVLVVYTVKLKFGLQSTGASAVILHSKKKRSRKSRKGENNEENGVKQNDNFWLSLNQPSTDGYTIGKLFVSNKEIAKGSNGTIVLEGIYESRPVAVKRLVRAYNDVALKEIQNLIVSDRHPNIVRWYGVEQDQNFVYLALERCAYSLNDLIFMHSSLGKNLDSEVTAQCTIHLDSMKDFIQNFELWKSDGYPSPLLLKLMRDIISGIAHLHDLGIVHRDLKPQNVLITSEKSLYAKLSDMGISKRLVGDMSTLSNHSTGYGSSGWQAPEQLLHGRQTRAVDLFSLGCVLFFCITGGRHPFGNRLERDVNISKNKIDLFLVEHIPEAVDLFLQLLDPDPEMRPKAIEVLSHPLFWNSEIRLSFFRDTSDRVELEDREDNSNLLTALESVALRALGGKWNEKMEPSFLKNIGHYRRYKFDSVRDLLRVMRNKLNHYRELPTEIQELIGPIPEGFDKYFASRFPILLVEVYNVMLRNCRAEEWFAKYLREDGQ